MPASTPSQRGVDVRSTTTGTPKNDASSWSPPLSVTTTRLLATRSSIWSHGTGGKNVTPERSSTVIEPVGFEPGARAGVQREHDRPDLLRAPARERHELLEARGVVDVRRAVRGHHDPGPVADRLCALAARLEHVDDRIADHTDPLVGHALARQELGGQCGGREVERRERARHPPVGFLERRRVVRAQPGLDMHDRDGEPARREAEQRHRVGVSEQHDRVGPARAEQLDRLLEHRADAVRGAAVELPAHVGVQAEVVEERVGERGVVVLAGGDHLGGDAVLPHRGHDGRELDDLGSSAERHEDVHSTINSSK